MPPWLSGRAADHLGTAQGRMEERRSPELSCDAHTASPRPTDTDKVASRARHGPYGAGTTPNRPELDQILTWITSRGRRPDATIGRITGRGGLSSSRHRTVGLGT